MLLAGLTADDARRHPTGTTCGRKHGALCLAGGSDPFKSAWPQALARPVSTSSHAYFAIEEDAFALQLATRLSTRSTTSRKIPFAHRARRARRRKKKRGGGAAGC